MQSINFLVFKLEAKSYIRFKITNGLKSKNYKTLIIHIDMTIHIEIPDNL